MTDSYQIAYREQAELRLLVEHLTSPVIPVKKLAHAAHMHENTVRNFIHGKALQPDNERAIREALRQLVPDALPERTPR